MIKGVSTSKHRKEEKGRIEDGTKVWVISLHVGLFLVYLSGLCERVISDLNGHKFYA